MGNLLSQARRSLDPEKDLWIAVIFQAFRDAVRLKDLEAREAVAIKNNKELHQTVAGELEAAREAMEWLTIPSEDLTEVCYLAGLHPDDVLNTRTQLENGTLTEFNTWKIK